MAGDAVCRARDVGGAGGIGASDVHGVVGRGGPFPGGEFQGAHGRGFPQGGNGKGFNDGEPP